MIFAGHGGFGGDFDHHFSLFRKLDGVGKEVAENLAQADGFEIHPARAVSGEPRKKVRYSSPVRARRILPPGYRERLVGRCRSGPPRAVRLQFFQKARLGPGPGQPCLVLATFRLTRACHQMTIGFLRPYLMWDRPVFTDDAEAGGEAFRWGSWPGDMTGFEKDVKFRFP